MVNGRGEIGKEEEAMLPIVGIPQTLAKGMERFRTIGCRAEGFEPICRLITGLVLSPNKTLQGIDDRQVWEGEAPSRRAMPEAVFESGWDSAAFMKQHRTEVAQTYPGRGRQVLSLDWTLAHHERGPTLYAVTRSYDYVERRMAWFQTVATAVVSNRDGVDGREVVAQAPHDGKAEAAYLKATANERDEQREEVQRRLLELLHDHKHRLKYRKRTELAVAIVRPLEAESPFPQASYAFDNGVLTLERTRLIERGGKHWVSELEVSRPIQWQGDFWRVDEVAADWRHPHPESVRAMRVSGRHGEETVFFALTTVVRLKRSGRKRLVMVHEQRELSDAPRFWVTDALHWESGRVIQTWSDCWASEAVHEAGQAGVGCGVRSGCPRKRSDAPSG